MLQMSKQYEPEFKKKIVRLHLEEGRTLKGLAAEYGAPHKVFENKLHQDFKAESINQKWCTDFTYLFLTDGSKRYNCTIIDLHDRSVIASITDKHITADLAKKTLQKAIDSQPGLNTNHLILHSDQGS